MKSSLFILFISLFIIGNNTVIAQNEINKVVEVVKPYVPVVSDASKINTLPVFTDTVVIKPSFQYSIVPLAINTDYQLNRINPAKMVSSPLTKLYKSYLKLGFGNYGTPLAEVSLNSLRSKKYMYGVFFHHQSSGGKINLDNKKKVFAGYSENDASVFGKRFFSKSFLYADAGITANTAYQYGYKPQIDTVFEKGDIRQKLFRAGINTGLRSSHTDSSKLTYHFNLNFNYTQNRYEQSQNDLRLLAEGSKLYNNMLVGLHVGLISLLPNQKLDTLKVNTSIFTIKPFFVLTNSEYRLTGGLNLLFENQYDKLSFYFYPDAEISINIARDVLVGFAGIYARIKEHSYFSIAQENPFINPGLLARNTNISSSLFGGFKGSLGSRASFVAKAEYLRAKYDYFFINDTLSTAQNQFTIIYDNVQRLNLYFETNYDFSKSLTFGLKADYNSYKLDIESYAWHRPGFQLTFSSRYNLRNKILANVDVISVSKRYAKIYENGEAKSLELPGVIDVNLGLEYRYTKILSAWLKLNNLAASKYYTWNYYPAQRFNFMVGITYSL